MESRIDVGTLVKITDTEDIPGINIGDIALVTEITEDDDLLLYFPTETYHWAYYSPSSVEIVKDLLAEYRIEVLDVAESEDAVLDKIRAEIRKKMMFNSFNEGYVLYDDITEVLDKYKAESKE